MTRLILHIGHAKTGTTSLQHSFMQARTELLEHGVLYPSPYRSKQHSALKTFILGPEFAAGWMAGAYGTDKAAMMKTAAHIWDAMLDDIAEYQPHTIVLSSETFFDIGQQQQTATFIDTLKTVADEIVVVAYLRDPTSRYLSSRQQAIKYGTIKQPPSNEEWYRDALTPYILRSDLQLDVHHFDHAQLIENDIVADFIARYLNEEAKEVVKKYAISINSSMSPEAMAVLEDFYRDNEKGRTHPLPQSLIRKLLARDAKLQGFSRPQYKPGVAKIIHDTAKDLKWIEEQFGVKFHRPDDDNEDIAMRGGDLFPIRNLVYIDEERCTALRKVLNKKIAKHEQRNHLFRGVFSRTRFARIAQKFFA